VLDVTQSMVKVVHLMTIPGRHLARPRLEQSFSMQKGRNTFAAMMTLSYRAIHQASTIRSVHIIKERIKNIKQNDASKLLLIVCDC
jgi:hypothetical protein